MTKILGLSGKMQSGKTTASNWIIGQQMAAVQIVDYIKINEKGELVIPRWNKDKTAVEECVFDPLTTYEPDVKILRTKVWPIVKLYSFAHILKESVSNIFSIPMVQLNGTNDDKNKPTQYTYAQFKPFVDRKISKEWKDGGLLDQPITGRVILQVFGTNICRRIDDNVWVNACLSRIKQDNPELAIITDVRFPSELEAIQKEGGKVMRFTRAPFAEEQTHASETSLDGYEDKFDAVIENDDIGIGAHNQAVNQQLLEWDYNTWDFSLFNDLQY